MRRGCAAAATSAWCSTPAGTSSPGMCPTGWSTQPHTSWSMCRCVAFSPCYSLLQPCVPSLPLGGQLAKTAMLLPLVPLPLLPSRSVSRAPLPPTLAHPTLSLPPAEQQLHRRLHQLRPCSHARHLPAAALSRRLWRLPACSIGATWHLSICLSRPCLAGAHHHPSDCAGRPGLLDVSPQGAAAHPEEPGGGTPAGGRWVGGGFSSRGLGNGMDSI